MKNRWLIRGESSRIILEAEADAGRRLIQLGFMRRFDRHHRELRDLVCSGSMGHPLMVHAVHRNPQAGEDFDDRMEIMDAAIHEIDVVPWLLGGIPWLPAGCFMEERLPVLKENCTIRSL